MMCQEVMDDMQRQLDGDLDDQESEALMTHLRHCPECAEMFDRLQLLSSGLENLPKVTPPYSLVDAILPRLAELTPETNTDMDNTAAAPLLPLADTDKAPIERRVQRPRRWFDRFSMRALGGVVAAGLVAGLFLVTYNAGNTGDGLSTAQESASSSTDDAAADTGAATFKSNLVTESATSEPMAKELASDEEVSTSSADNDKPATDEPKEPEDIYRNAEQPSTSQAERSDGSNSGGQAQTDSADEVADGAGNSPNQSFTAQPDPAMQADSVDPADKEVKSFGASSSDEEQVQDNKAQINGITQIANDFVSPDGHYKASIDPDANILNIYVQADMMFVLHTEPAPGGIGSIVWSEDSKSLTYEAIAEDGTSTSYRIDVEAGTITPLQNTP